MKKLILLTYCLISCFVLQAGVEIDSAQFVNALKMGIPIALKLANVPVVPMIPNDILTAIISVVGGFIWGILHYHSRVKKGK